MQVETYEIEDVTSEASQMANDSAALELIEKLGMVGQNRLMNKETVTRVPYRNAEEEIQVYKALNPESCDALLTTLTRFRYVFCKFYPTPKNLTFSSPSRFGIPKPRVLKTHYLSASGLVRKPKVSGTRPTFTSSRGGVKPCSLLRTLKRWP